MANRIGAGGPFIRAPVLPDFLPNNAGPQGNIGPTVIIRPGPRPGLYWYDADEWVPSIKVDDDYWLINRCTAYQNARAITSDDDVWVPLASTPSLDDDYCAVPSGAQASFRQFIFYEQDDLSLGIVGDDGGQVWTSAFGVDVASVVTADDEWVPATSSIPVDEDLWPVNRHSSYQYAKAVVADGDDWIASIGVDEDLPWLPKQSRVFGTTVPITDDDVLPISVAPFGLDEEYWYVNPFTGALYSIPVAVWQQWNLDDEAWPSGIVPPVVITIVDSSGGARHDTVRHDRVRHEKTLVEREKERRKLFRKKKVRFALPPEQQEIVEKAVQTAAETPETDAALKAKVTYLEELTRWLGDAQKATAKTLEDLFTLDVEQRQQEMELIEEEEEAIAILTAWWMNEG